MWPSNLVLIYRATKEAFKSKNRNRNGYIGFIDPKGKCLYLAALLLLLVKELKP